jgi:RNA polymerase sigma-70 factor (ECF subfamily)
MAIAFLLRQEKIIMATYAANLPSIDSVLGDRLRGSDEGVFQEILHQFGQKIFRTALKILKEEESAKDAVQETMINIHRAGTSFRGEAKLSTWINRITVNVCLEMIRKNRKHANRVPEDVSDYLGLEDHRSPNPFRSAHRAEVANRVHSALARLSEKHSRVVRMHDLEGYTIREIAEAIGVAEGTIKSRLFYGREELKKELVA